MASAYLVLDDGRIFEGESWGASGETFGEAVFATGMTGYQETLTDPSYHKQVVVMTAPHIGNTGVNPHDHESEKIWVSGFVVRNPSPVTSNWRSTGSLEEWLIEEGIVCIQGVDTRAITRHLRDRGSMRVGIFSGLEMTREEMVIAVRKSPTMVGANLVADVSTKSPYVVPAIGEKRFTVVALDLGIKAATPRALSERGVEVHVLPYNSSFEEIKSYSPDGVFLSNGPGDPASMDKTVEIVREILGAEIPIFGICFGHQILGRALGFSTYKLQFGHRGINQPVIDRSTGKVEITAHNHGFALQAPTEGTFTTVYGPGEVTHLSLNDGVVEGLALLERPAFSVQYHPEAAAGPHDASYLFDRFIDLMAGQWVIL
ncbi:MAG: glutamine-hydrolyzing carbamoyl-phosphate synthase small subunit [Actinobacteria bacterium]|uniref:carbamoyl-phosphate synthase (glutamine-hydrolyzing) n=1 Tax=freshwater metagenome TaxID=449393 RepID=A0A6J7CP11_9ZZZZ|nr:glutamine-hydrolyzing carbamoyl-phosphate synthase small subunit [Actinomycetota bacterium]MSX24519.1 glutamine-hydrolyzing carbamoyl-phosphate synthase small subunit [Actinomycetota bacterium]MSY46659.1 glutamine-hydrolyzing carbamoyl-phosphate synthase small subunit [Actinomycetota bacterium]MTB00203.1 glutamine-hydrolyzing carbamoyl-phosphate synthase small subunit [Actinomycetota bacterium]